MSRERRAQELVLDRVLKHEQLPGMHETIGFSDVDENSEPVLLDDRDLSEFGLPPGVRVARSDDRLTIETEGRVPVFQFLEPEPFPGKISVRLRLSVMTPDHGLVPLEELVATFHDSDPLTVDTVSLLAT